MFLVKFYTIFATFILFKETKVVGYCITLAWRPSKILAHRRCLTLIGRGRAPT
jgi:hypothetical protein